MALPTAPTSPLTWTKLASTNPAVGPDLYYAAVTSGVGSSVIYAAGNGVSRVASGATPDGPTVTWTALAVSSAGAKGMPCAYLPIATSHGLYYFANGHLSYE